MIPPKYEVAAPPFKSHANYGTWSIDFGQRERERVRNIEIESLNEREKEQGRKEGV